MLKSPELLGQAGPEIVESEPVEQEVQETEDQDEKAITDEKVDWDSKSEKDQDDPWSVGW